MKISIIRNFVVSALGAALALNLAGCGGGTVPDGPAFPTGIYVATGGTATIKYVSNPTMAGEQEIAPSSASGTYSSAFDHNGRMYIGASVGKLICIPKLGSTQQTVLTGVPGDSITAARCLAFDSFNRIYFGDLTMNRIVRIDNMSGAGWKVLDLSGIATNALDFGKSLAIDSQDRIYVTARNQGKVFRFNNMDDASPVVFDALGIGMGGLSDPEAICIDKADHIYVADRNNNRIVRFDDMTGTGWMTFGTFGSGVGQFKDPEDISVDENGHICVIDSINGRLVYMDDMTGAGWATFGGIGVGPGLYNQMNNVCFH